MRATYQLGSSYAPLEVEWTDADGELIDFSSGWTFDLSARQVGDAAAAFTKSTGIAGLDGSDGYNLSVEWSVESDEDLNTLTEGRWYVTIAATPAGGDPIDLVGEIVMRGVAQVRGYCEIPDVLNLLGDGSIADGKDVASYVNAAADEMDSYIGQAYTLPLPLLSYGPNHWAVKRLRTLNAQLAAARMMMTASNAEDVHAYGGRLADEVEKALCDFREGKGNLPFDRNQNTTAARGPAHSNRDARSGVQAFEDYFMRGGTKSWRPGA